MYYYKFVYILLKIHALNLGTATLYRVEENEYARTVRRKRNMKMQKTGKERISSFCYAKAYSPRNGIVGT